MPIFLDNPVKILAPRKKNPRLLLASTLVIILGCLFQPCLADSESDLSRLEIKFFQHSYPKDAEPNRLERLENMVFGEVKSGADGDRLSKLIEAVPAPEPSATSSLPLTPGADNAVSENKPEEPRSKTSSRRKSQPAPQDDASQESASAPVQTDEKYPAVTAIEQKTFGQDYVGEPVEKRLARLESKVFGKPSSNNLDLSDRVDALKQKTGIDVAKLAPRGSDWSDDDDDMAVSPPPRRSSEGYSSSPYAREDARSFSGRDLQQDFQKAFGASSGYGGSSQPNASAYIPSMTDSYGTGGTTGLGYQSSRSSYPGGVPPVTVENAGMGLNQQVSALETEIFQKNWSHDPLPTRLNRLEATVFPNDKSLADKSLPDRVANLVAHVPISSPSSYSSNRKQARAKKDDDLDDFSNAGSQNISMSQSQTPQQGKSGGGLSKIMNSLGNMLSGGGMGYGGYPVRGGALATDPSTGMLYDPSTGNLIDPSTGAVVGRRAAAYNSYNTGYGANPYGYGGGFNSGFAPLGSMNRSFGFGGMGMGMGGMRMGGMGMGGMGMGGIWP